MTFSDSELRSYLLGRMAEAEAERLEALLLEDEEQFQNLRGIEDDLFDDYARDALAPEERQSFLTRYGNERQRIRFARTLARRAAAPKILPFRPRPVIPWSLAAALVAAVGGVLLLRQSASVTPPPPGTATPPPVPAVSATVVDQAPAPAPVTLAFNLNLGATRANEGPVAIDVPADIDIIVLRVRLDPADRFNAYSLELRATSGERVWRADALKAMAQASEPRLEGHIPTTSLKPGLYELAARGSNPGGAETDLGFVTVRVGRGR